MLWSEDTVETHCWHVLHAEYFFSSFSPSFLCRSDEDRSDWISLNLIPGDTISQPALDGRTDGCKDVLLMSSEMKFTIISGQRSQKRKRGWIRATAFDSEPTALLPHYWNENCCLQSLTEQHLFFTKALFVCRERPCLCLMQTCSTKLDVHLFLTFAAWIIFQHCCFCL